VDNERAFRKTAQGGYKVRLGTWVRGGGLSARYDESRDTVKNFV
jgi:hypothetical protein